MPKPALKSSRTKRSTALLESLFGPKALASLDKVLAMSPAEVKQAADRARIRHLTRQVSNQRRITQAVKRVEQKRRLQAVSAVQAESLAEVEKLNQKISGLLEENARIESLVQHSQHDPFEVKRLKGLITEIGGELVRCAEALEKADPDAYKRLLTTHFQTGSTKLSQAPMSVTSGKPLPGGMSVVRQRR